MIGIARRSVPPHQRTIWWRTAQAAAVTPPLTADTQADIAVVGAGFTGLTAAWHLARRGARVIVLEAGAVGSGASGLNAGFVVPNFAKADPATVIARLGADRGTRLLETVAGSADRIFATIRDHNIACDAAQTGWLHVAHQDAMLSTLRDRAEAWQRLGRPIRILDAANARHLAGLRHCAGALLDPSGGTLHPLNYAYGLARLAMAAGATLHQAAPVDAVARSGTGWVLATCGRKVCADRVLLCTNAADHGIARRLGRAIIPLHVYQIATEPLDADTVRRISPRRNPVADTRANLFTYRLDRDDRLISGGMAIVPAGAEGRMARMIADRLRTELTLPRMPAVAAVWRGTAAMTTDFMPHLYEFGPGFIGGIGCNGRGVAFTSMLGEVLANAALGTPLADLPIPTARPRAIPLRLFSAAAPGFAIAKARWQDKCAGL